MLLPARVISIAVEVLHRWKRHEMDLAAAVTTPEPALETTLMVSKQRQDPLFIVPKALHPIGWNPSYEKIGHGHARRPSPRDATVLRGRHPVASLDSDTMTKSPSD
jgi:hypothetical protein